MKSRIFEAYLVKKTALKSPAPNTTPFSSNAGDTQQQTFPAIPS